MVQAFTTTVIGSMPKPPWLYTPAIALDGRRDHFGTGGTWRLDGEVLRQAQDDARRVWREWQRMRQAQPGHATQDRLGYAAAITTRTIKGKL